MSTTCKSCGAEIIWVKTRGGKAMPLDAKPEKRMVLVGFEGAQVGDQDPTPIAEVQDTYLSHFATCPNADQHRRKP